MTLPPLAATESPSHLGRGAIRAIQSYPRRVAKQKEKTKPRKESEMPQRDVHGRAEANDRK